jgi:monoamine oxidase
MTPPNHIVIVGAGAAGLMAASELARAGKRVTILEARERCGGRIWPLPEAEFGYVAEGGAEFVHGAAPVTRRVLREAELALSPRAGRRFTARHGVFSPDEPRYPQAELLHRELMKVTTDLPIAEFLATRFAGPEYAELRRGVTRMVEGYDAADPSRASTMALREEWMEEGVHQQGRIAKGYGAVIAFLAAQCRRHGAALHFGATVNSIDAAGGGIVVSCRDGTRLEGDAAILAVPLPLLTEIALPPATRAKAAACADIGYGNVVKFLLRFTTRFWADHSSRGLGDLSFLVSEANVPTWWTQHPSPYPVLTGWLAGPRTDKVAQRSAGELVETGLAALAETFALPLADLRRDLVAARAIDWSRDEFARGAYSYATPRTRAAQAALEGATDEPIFFSGEALYAGPDMGTVEAALASGRDTAERLLAA